MMDTYISTNIITATAHELQSVLRILQFFVDRHLQKCTKKSPLNVSTNTITAKITTALPNKLYSGHYKATEEEGDPETPGE